MSNVLDRPIVAGVTPDASGAAATRRTLELSSRSNVPFELVYAVPDFSTATAGLPGVSWNDIEREHRDLTVTALSELLEDTNPELLGKHLDVLAGPAARTLINRARARVAGLIVLGPHRARKLFDLGNTGRALMAHAPCPVWNATDTTDDIRRILVPVDLSEDSGHALRVAVDFARRFDARLHVLHAFLPPAPTIAPHPGVGWTLPENFFEKLEEADRESFLTFVKEHVPDDVDSTHTFTEEAPTGAILSRLEKDADLVVMATQGRGKLSAAFLGSVTYAVLRKSQRPVVAVPHPDDVEARVRAIAQSTDPSAEG